jgi:hypothetical protein
MTDRWLPGGQKLPGVDIHGPAIIQDAIKNKNLHATTVLAELLGDQSPKVCPFAEVGLGIRPRLLRLDEEE